MDDKAFLRWKFILGKLRYFDNSWEYQNPGKERPRRNRGWAPDRHGTRHEEYIWKVIKDPSGFFFGNLFRRFDIATREPWTENGWFEGTTFENIETLELIIVQKNGIPLDLSTGKPIIASL